MGRSERKHGRKKELSNHIESSWGFEELSEESNDWEEDRLWKSNGETKGKKKLEEFYRKFKKKMGPGAFSKNREVASKRMEGRRFRAILDVLRGRGNLSAKRGLIMRKKVLENDELAGEVTSKWRI